MSTLSPICESEIPQQTDIKCWACYKCKSINNVSETITKHNYKCFKCSLPTYHPNIKTTDYGLENEQTDVKNQDLNNAHAKIVENTRPIQDANNINEDIIEQCVRVASIQSPSIFGNVQANIETFTELITKAALNGAKIIVLPEAAITGYASQDFKHSWCIPIENRRKYLDKTAFTGHNPKPYAQYRYGAMIQHFKKLCKKLKIYLTVPYIEKVTTKKYVYYNAITLINPFGNIIAHYRKTYLWEYYDKCFTTKGKDIVTVETEYGKIGLAICYDINKILPQYKEKSIWSLLYCIAWVDVKSSEWFDNILPKTLIANNIQYNIIGCNWSVAKPKENEKYTWNGYGKTTIYGPRGTIIASTKNLYDSEIIYANIPYSKPKLNDSPTVIYGYLRQIKNKMRINIPSVVINTIVTFISKFFIFGVGENDCGQLGLGHVNSVAKYTQLFSLQKILFSVDKIYANYKSLVVFNYWDEIYVAGWNYFVNRNGDRAYVTKLTRVQDKPSLPKVFSSGKCNENYGLLFTVCNRLFCSGDYQISPSKNHQIEWDDQMVIMDIKCTKYCALLLTEDFKLYQWTYDRWEFSDTSMRPKFIMDDIAEISAGSLHCLFVTKKHKLLCFGDNSYGQCGMEKQENQSTFSKPTINSYFEQNDINIVKAHCGEMFSLCIDDKGCVYCFGENIDGAIGNGSSLNNVYIPYKVQFNGKNNKIIDASCGMCHCIVLSKNNDVFCWGNNSSKQVTTLSSKSVISKPLLLSKVMELGVDQFSFVEKILAINFETVIIINPQKRMENI